MSIFLTWNQENDAEVRAAYISAVGEYIQSDTDFNGQKYMAASSRATPEMLANVPHIIFGDSPDAVGWNV